MTNGKTNPKVDAFIARATTWHDEFAALRAIVLTCPLSEELKWGVPCYTVGGRNVVLIHGFNDYCALLFFKGALLADPHKLLIRQTENVQSGRQIRFADVDRIHELEAVLKAYIGEAIEVEKRGLKVSLKATAEFAVPEEWRATVDANADLKAAFEALTPGRQRGYLLHFAQAKQSKTRLSRIEKALPRILDGVGLDD